MNKYAVRIYYTSYVIVGVEAENEDEARRLAYEKAESEDCSKAILANLQEADSSDVEDITEDQPW